MVKQVTIVDYETGNLLSVRRAFEKLGVNVSIAHNASEIESAQSIVLPGVGAFSIAVEALKEKGLFYPLKEWGKANKPFLGICLGMQLLFDESEEFGVYEGLGLIPGRVTRIPDCRSDGKPHDVPHISWASLAPPENTSWDGTFLEGFKQGQETYFVHSYEGVPEDNKYRLANADYDGHKFCAIVGDGNIIGCQFHPEKSGPVGLSILERFLNLY